MASLKRPRSIIEGSVVEESAAPPFVAPLKASYYENAVAAAPLKASHFENAAASASAASFRRSASAPVSKNEKEAVNTRERYMPKGAKKYRYGQYLEDTSRLVLTVMAHGQQPRPGPDAVQTLDPKSAIILSTTTAGPHYIGSFYSPSNKEVENYGNGDQLKQVFREMTREGMEKDKLKASHTAMPGEPYLNRELDAYSSNEHIVGQRKVNKYFGVFESFYDGTTSTPLTECKRLQKRLIELGRNFRVSDIIAEAQAEFGSDRRLLIVLFSCDANRRNGSKENSRYGELSRRAPSSHYGLEYLRGPYVPRTPIQRAHLVPGSAKARYYLNNGSNSIHYVSEEQARDIPYQRYLRLIQKIARRNSRHLLSPVGESAAYDPDMDEPVAAAVAESVKPPSGGRRTRKKKRRSKTRRR